MQLHHFGKEEENEQIIYNTIDCSLGIWSWIFILHGGVLMTLHRELKEHRFFKEMADPEVFYAWLGGDPGTSLTFSDVWELPVFERLGLEFTLKKTNGPRRKKWQAMMRVEKGSTFLSAYTRLNGGRRYSKLMAVMSGLLSIWELETHRKVDACRDAFGVGDGVRGHFQFPDPEAIELGPHFHWAETTYTT